MMRGLLTSEAAGGLILIAVSAVALITANTPLAGPYFALLESHLGGLSVLHWVNDGLMALFFLLVGLEVKRELLKGELATWSNRLLPGIAALGGMIVPALVFLTCTRGSAEDALRGWAIPTATDIAFALGVLALLGSRVPASLKIFLTALAIMDDLGAVIIIALFYTSGLHVGALLGGGGVLLLLAGLNRAGVTRLWPYLILGVALWILILKSGIHATLAGVLLALTIPLKTKPESSESPLERLEHAIHPWVGFAVIPIFGFANAGVSFAGFTLLDLTAPVSLGVALGLFVGKQIGVFVFSWAAIKGGFAELPAGATWRQFYGVALLCGIGFTMSLFIGLLAFKSPELQNLTKLGVMIGSLLSALVGAGVLLRSTGGVTRREVER